MSTKVPPVVSLKDRLAALEQRQNVAKNASSNIPKPSEAPASANRFKSKIAQFEEKGGIPIPRGSFGLGAPPVAGGGPRNRGELYGNRIPTPVRAVGGTFLGLNETGSASARAASPLGFNQPAPSPTPYSDRRRSTLMEEGEVDPTDPEGYLNNFKSISPQPTGSMEYQRMLEAIPKGAATFNPRQPISPQVTGTKDFARVIGPRVSNFHQQLNSLSPQTTGTTNSNRVEITRGTAFGDALGKARAADAVSGIYIRRQDTGLTPQDTGNIGSQYTGNGRPLSISRGRDGSISPIDDDSYYDNSAFMPDPNSDFGNFDAPPSPPVTTMSRSSEDTIRPHHHHVLDDMERVEEEPERDVVEESYQEEQYPGVLKSSAPTHHMSIGADTPPDEAVVFESTANNNVIDAEDMAAFTDSFDPQSRHTPVEVSLYEEVVEPIPVEATLSSLEADDIGITVATPPPPPTPPADGAYTHHDPAFSVPNSDEFNKPSFLKRDSFVPDIMVKPATPSPMASPASATFSHRAEVSEVAESPVSTYEDTPSVPEPARKQLPVLPIPDNITLMEEEEMYGDAIPDSSIAVGFYANMATPETPTPLSAGDVHMRIHRVSAGDTFPDIPASVQAAIISPIAEEYDIDIVQSLTTASVGGANSAPITPMSATSFVTDDWEEGERLVLAAASAKYVQLPETISRAAVLPIEQSVPSLPSTPPAAALEETSSRRSTDSYRQRALPPRPLPPQPAGLPVEETTTVVSPPSPDTPVLSPSTPPARPPRRALDAVQVSPRPMTMFETSNTPIKKHLTPALPLSPEEAEFGTITFHRPTQTFSSRFHGQYMEPDLSSHSHLSKDPYGSFSSVVYGKVTELASEVATPSNKQSRISRNPTSMMLDLPNSATSGDLATLLAQSALLEKKLEAGELPSEMIGVRSAEEARAGLLPSAAIMPSNAYPRTADPRTEQIPKGRKRSFRNPLGRSKSDYSRDPPSLLQGRSKSTFLHADSDSLATAKPPVPTPTEPLGEPPSPPPKSPQNRYIANLKKFTQTTGRPSVRQSLSTSSELSSEDSMSLVTPPERSPDLFTGNVNGIGYTMETRSHVAWPHLSTKKSFGSMRDKAQSLAGKILSRSRSKSSISTTSSEMTTSERIQMEAAAEPLPAVDVRSTTPNFPHPTTMITPPSARLELHPVVTEPQHMSSNRNGHSNAMHDQKPPRRSTESTRSAHRGKSYTLGVPQTEGKHTSWVSLASTTSSVVPSPLDDMFDDFPAVPEVPPLPAPFHRSGNSISRSASVSNPTLVS